MVSDFEYSEIEITRRLIELIIPSFIKKTKDLNHYINFVPPIENVKHYQVSSKNLQDIGWNQEVFIQEGLEKTVNFYRKKHESKKKFISLEITDF